MIRISEPVIDSRQIRAVRRVLRSGQLVQGPEVRSFENEVSTLLGVKHAVAVNSGTSALHLGMLAAGIGPGDEVIVPSFSFAATANSVILAGAKPVFGDISLDDYNLDPNHTESLITSRTRAIMPVHLYGHPARMEEFRTICDRYGLLLFEDAAQSLGAKLNGLSVGSWGDFSALSFYATKNVSSGEGGMVITNDASIARRVRLLRNQGQEVKYQNEIIGFNNRMSELHAAIGRVQLTYLETWVAKRRHNASSLSSGLVNFVTPSTAANTLHAFHQYTIRVPRSQRENLISHLKTNDVECAVYYPIATHQLPSFINSHQDCGQRARLPNTETAVGEVLSLPVHPRLKKKQLSAIISAVNNFKDL
jgi:perosamine synthetase